MTRMFLSMLLLFTLAPTAHADDAADALPAGLRHHFRKAPKAFSCPSGAIASARYKALKERIRERDFKLDALLVHVRALEGALLKRRVALRGVTTCTPKGHRLRRERAAIAKALAETRQLEQRYDEQLQEMQRCRFRHTLARLSRHPSLTPKEQAMVRQLQQLQRHFAKGADLSRIKARYREMFRKIYTHYWGQKRLAARSCQVLTQAYRGWASFYESDNRANRTIAASSRRIPLYNGNGHNDSYRVWAWEVQKGRIPPQGLTLLHLDTHPDMGAYRDRSPHHWTDRVLTLADVNGALAHPEALRPYLRRKIKAAQGVSQRHKQVLIDHVNKTPLAQLRQTLRRQIYRRVHNIAHPLTAAAYAGVTKKLLLCMPPWSHRFAMSKIDPKTQRSQGITLELIKERKSEDIYFGVPNTMTTHPFVDAAEMPSFTTYNPTKKTYQSLPHRINFHVTACTNENPSTVDASRWSPLPPLRRYFTRQREGKDGFILGFDLDVFSTNGAQYDNYVIPRSYGRDRSLKAALKAQRHHAKHAKRAKQSQPKAKPKPRVTAQEYKLVKYRLKGVFDRLREARRQGYIPRLITIADSTRVARAYRDGLHRAAMSGGNYVPPCLAFLLNYHVKKKLAQLYRSRLYPTFQSLATSRAKTSKKRKPRKPAKKPSLKLHEKAS